MSAEFFSGRGNPNAIAVIGDSRAGVIADALSTALNRAANNWLTCALALLGQRLDIAYVGNAPGKRSDEYFAASINWRGATANNVTAALASNALWVMPFGIVNDVAQGYTAAQIWAGYNGSIGYDAFIDRAILLGKQVILPLDPGATNLTANQIGELHKHNQRCIQKARGSRAIHIFDMASSCWKQDDYTGSIVFKTGYFKDTTHLGNLGCMAVGADLATFLDKLIDPRQHSPLGASMTKAQGGVNWNPNPSFGVTSGGTKNTGITGTMAGSSIGSRSGAATAVASVVAADRGNGQQMVCTFTASGDQIRASLVIDPTGLTPGDIFRLRSKVKVDAGASGLLNVNPRIVFFADSNTVSRNAEGFYSVVADGALGNGALTLDLITEPWTCPQYTSPDSNGFLAQLQINATAAGSATVTWSEVVLEKVV